MFSAKLTMLLFGFIVVGTTLTFVGAMPVDEDEYPINGVDNDAFEDEISADKHGLVDDEEVEEGEGEERNLFDELDAKADEEVAKEEEEELEKGLEEAEEEEDIKNGADEEEFEEEIADAEEESEESEVGDDEDDEAKAAEEENAASEEEEAAAEEEKAIADEEEEIEQKAFPYNWYDKVKKFFKREK